MTQRPFYIFFFSKTDKTDKQMKTFDVKKVPPFIYEFDGNANAVPARKGLQFDGQDDDISNDNMKKTINGIVHGYFII